MTPRRCTPRSTCTPATCSPRPSPGKNDSTNFCAFLDDLERCVDPGLAIQVIHYNGASHVSRQTKAWFAAHPCWVVH
jgi:hypothetical protein